MRFNNEKERLDLIKGFEERAESLTKSMKSEIPEKTKVTFETVTEWDANDKIVEVDDIDNPGEKIKNHGGDIYVCYIKQPHIMTAVVLMDKINKREMFSAGYLGWDAMVIPPPISSKEINEHLIKFGLVPRISNALDGAMPDIKKN